MSDGVLQSFGLAVLQQRGALLPWAAVFFGTGIGGYFALPYEPAIGGLWLLTAISAALLLLRARLGEAPGLLLAAIILVLLGYCHAGLRANWVAAPVLDFRFYGPIEGRIVKIDRSASDKVRLTLDQVRLRDLPPVKTPETVRVSLHGDQSAYAPQPGHRVMLTGHLSPPQGPVEPGGFDFQRAAWFSRLGAVGYTRTPVLLLEPADGWSLALHRARMRLSTFVQSRITGEAGGVAAAITTGDRSGLSRQVVDDLRRSNLAHLLAISGLHMGLLTGFVFALLRLGLALIPPIALRFPIRKWAAAAALLVGAAYLALSGGNVATERAFVMVAVMLVAVLLDRRAVTLRSVAVAALIVLLIAPQALLGPGFQMSFAATTALVAVFGWLRDHGPDWKAGWIRHLRPAVGVVISSFVAGAATAPFAAAHFNLFAQFGLIANLLSVPLMGAVVVPAAVLAFLLQPVGLSGPAFWIMGQGINWILAVAAQVAAIENATRHVPSPPQVVLPLVALGALVLILWNGKARVVGAIPLVLAVLLWAGTQRPDLLVSDSGRLVGVMTPEGRALSRDRGDGFVARVWLENDGDPVAQSAAAKRTSFTGDRAARVFAFSGREFIVLSGAKAADRVAAACAVGQSVIVAAKAKDPCVFLDATSLRQSGAVAIWASADGFRQLSVRDVTGNRLWNTKALAERRLSDGLWSPAFAGHRDQ